MDLGHVLIELRTCSHRIEFEPFSGSHGSLVQDTQPAARKEALLLSQADSFKITCPSLHAAAVVLFETASCENTHAQENDNTHVVRDCVCCGKTSHAHLWAMAMCLRDGVQEAVSERFQSGFRPLWACHWSLSNFFGKERNRERERKKKREREQTK